MTRHLQGSDEAERAGQADASEVAQRRAKWAWNCGRVGLVITAFVVFAGGSSIRQYVEAEAHRPGNDGLWDRIEAEHDSTAAASAESLAGTEKAGQQLPASGDVVEVLYNELTRTRWALVEANQRVADLERSQNRR